MKKRILPMVIRLGIVGMLIALCDAPLGQTAEAFQWFPKKQVAKPNLLPTRLHKTVVVDPGHGGIDGGTSRGGLLEKTITLEIAKNLALELDRAGFDVTMTRRTDIDCSGLFPSPLSGRHRRDLQNRLDLLRKARAVGFLSIHVNSSANPSDRGPLVFYTVHSEASQQLASLVQAKLNALADTTQRPIGRKNLFVIRHAPCPAILAEVGYVTNDRDAIKLRQPMYLKQVAHAIAVGAIPFLRQQSTPNAVVGNPNDDWVPPALSPAVVQSGSSNMAQSR
ncbi:N-acetylmuramoyl-L-alanine amidase family protein [Ferroacidibacillus organovorans]|nr:N-acetylmuramoyl-L-alanine amidase [Ferroacidibacillus organovorans]